MLQIIIFSFNRAMQLDTLLTSLKEMWLQPAYSVEVLYNTSTKDFEKGYEILKRKYADVSFSRECKAKQEYSISDYMNLRNMVHLYRYPSLRRPRTDFRKRLISMLENNSSRYIMFMTDDAIFINKVSVSQKIMDWIASSPFQNQFSLRLGNGMNEEPANVKRDDMGLLWNTYDVPQNNNWGYHFSVDAHIYSKELIIKLFKKYVFTNPNSLEGYICEQIRRHKWLTNGRSPLSSKLLSFPINMVQTFSDNETLGVDSGKMNGWFLDGYTMKYPVPEVVDTFQQYPNYVYLFKDGNVMRKELKI